MTPLTYVIIGLIVGGALAAIVFFAVRRRSAPSDLLMNGRTAEEEIIRRLETLDRGLRDEFSRNREEGASAAKSQREELGKSLEGVRAIVDVRLKELQQDNAKQIDKMRATVDEKLQGTLEKRLGESFKLVSERLEQVHKGLGAMQQLASDVGGLQKVLSNVKMRGGWGEVQPANWISGTSAARLSGDFCWANDAGGVAQQFTDGISNARDSETFQRSLELARWGENRIWKVRRIIGGGEGQARPGREARGPCGRSLARHYQETPRCRRATEQSAAAVERSLRQFGRGLEHF